MLTGSLCVSGVSAVQTGGSQSHPGDAEGPVGVYGTGLPAPPLSHSVQSHAVTTVHTITVLMFSMFEMK